MCINAVTKTFHAEKDIGYTLISVPDQERSLTSKDKRKDSYFLFQICEKTIALKIKNNVSFIFHSILITHCQYCCDGIGNTVSTRIKSKDL